MNILLKGGQENLFNTKLYMDLITLDEEDDDIVNEETLTFHSNVRENIVSIKFCNIYFIKLKKFMWVTTIL